MSVYFGPHLPAGLSPLRFFTSPTVLNQSLPKQGFIQRYHSQAGAVTLDRVTVDRRMRELKRKLRSSTTVCGSHRAPQLRKVRGPPLDGRSMTKLII